MGTRLRFWVLHGIPENSKFLTVKVAAGALSPACGVTAALSDNHGGTKARRGRTASQLHHGSERWSGISGVKPRSRERSLRTSFEWRASASPPCLRAYVII